MTRLKDSAALRSETDFTSASAPSHAVWDRLWARPLPEGKDDALIERERRSRRWTMIVRQLNTTFGPGRALRTIELGCGRGDLSVLLAQRGARVTLFDASARALDQARARFDRLKITADYKQGDLLGSLEELSDRYDVALSSGVIEHFENDDRTRVVRAHHDVLRPGGLGVISVPNAWCIPYRLRKWYLELRGWWPYGLELPYAKRELLRRARAAGFARTQATCLRFDRSLRLPVETGAPSGTTGGSDGTGAPPDRSNVLDTVMGLVLILFGWRSL